MAGTLLEADLVRAALGPLFLLGLFVILKIGKQRAGRLFMLVGVLHVLGGLYVGREPVARIVREGFIGEGDSALGNLAAHTDKELAFWFLLWGVYAFVLGEVASWIEREGRRVPARIGWQLLFVHLVAAILVPKGGFWFLLIPSILIIRDASKPAATH